MTTKSVAIRLGTQGKAQVKSDWAEIHQAGETAFRGITDSARQMTAANDAEFNRMSAGYDRAVAEMEAADRRRAATAEKLNAIVPRSAVQARIDTSVGSGYGEYAGSARTSAEVFRELLALEDAQRVKAEALRAVIDPLAAAQARYNVELAETRALRVAGMISADELAKAEALLKARLDDVATGSASANRMSTMLGMQFSQMSQQVLAGGNALQAIAMQLPDVAVVMANTETKAGSFASFMGGPWGIAMTSAIALAAGIVPALLDGGDAAEKAERAHETLADKLNLTKHGYQEVIAAAREYNAEQSKANLTTLDSVRLAAEQASKTLLAAIAIRERNKALLDGAYAQMDAPRNAQEAAGASIEVLALQSQVANEDAKIAVLRQTAQNASNDVADALAKIDSDPVAKARAGFEELRKQARATITDVDALRKRLADLYTAEQKAVEAAQKAQRADRAGSSATNAASTGDMVALIKQLFPGASITSTTGGKHVKGSDHYAGRAIDFVPAGGMGRYSTEEVEQILRDAGVTIRRNAGGREQLFGPGRPAKKPGDHDDHFHVAWTGTASPEAAQRIAERQEREAQRVKDEAIRRQRDFDQAGADLDSKILVLRRRGLTDATAIADFERQQAQVETDKYNVAVEAKVKLGDLTRAQADELEAKRRLIGTLETEQIDREVLAVKLRDASTLEDARSGLRSEALRVEEGLARTMADRREIGLQILDLEKEEARRRYQLTIDLGKLGQATADQVTAAEEGLRGLDSTFAGRREGVMRQTAGPFEAYADEISQTKQQIYERVQGFAIDELDYFRKGLSDAVTDRLGVKDPLLSQVIDLFIEQVLIRPIMESMQNASSGAGGGFLGSLIKAAGSVVNGYIGSGAGSGGSSGGYDASAGHAHAAIGSEHYSGGYTWLAENGPELVNVPRGSKITPAAETRRILSGSNDNMRPIVLQQFDLTGTYTTAEMMAQMDERSRAAAAEVTQAGITQLIDQNRRSYGRLLNPGM